MLVKNERGLYLAGIKGGRLVWTGRILDALEFRNQPDAEQFMSVATGIPSFRALEFVGAALIAA